MFQQLVSCCIKVWKWIPFHACTHLQIIAFFFLCYQVVYGIRPWIRSWPKTIIVHYRALSAFVYAYSLLLWLFLFYFDVSDTATVHIFGQVCAFLNVLFSNYICVRMCVWSCACMGKFGQSTKINVDVGNETVRTWSSIHFGSLTDKNFICSLSDGSFLCIVWCPPSRGKVQ